MGLVLDTLSRKRANLSEKRIAICEQCPEYSKRTSRCDVCGCFMNFKTLLYDASCPLDKWGPENLEK